jgi:hypothetical protein
MAISPQLQIRPNIQFGLARGWTACDACPTKRRQSEGAGKGGGGLPVREIREVIFADGCRQPLNIF